MKPRLLIILLGLVTVLFAIGLSFAGTQQDGPIIGSGSITKSGGKVRAFASASATNAAQTGWYWIHAQVLPYNPQYRDVDSGQISGYLYESAYVRRTGQKSNGRAYCSMWAQSSQGYHDVLIDLP